MMKDLTERKTVYLDDAIDVIVGCTNCGTEDELRAYAARHSLENLWTGGIVDAIDAIKRLPSAQYVLTCDGCRHVGTYDTDFPCNVCVRMRKDYYE